MERARRWRVRCRHDRHGVDGGDLDAGVGRDGSLEVLHGREELRVEGGVAGVEEFVADGYDRDCGAGDEGGHVGGNPLGGEGRVGGELGDVGIGGADDDGDVGAGEGLDEVGVGAVEADFGDGGGLEELGCDRRRREVVGHLAVVHSDKWLRTCRSS